MNRSENTETAPLTQGEPIVIVGYDWAVNKVARRRGTAERTFSVVDSDNPLIHRLVGKNPSAEHNEVVFRMDDFPNDQPLPVMVHLRSRVMVREFNIHPTIAHLRQYTRLRYRSLPKIDSAMLSRRDEPNNHGEYVLTIIPTGRR